MARVGRKDKYETFVKPRFKEIEKKLNEGATERNLAKYIGISYSTWNKYKVDHVEFRELCQKQRVTLIEDLRSALVKKALGFTYEEKKQYITEDDKGKKRKHTEITTKYSAPDTTAIFGALNIYDETYVKDKKAHELKEQELELRKQMLDDKNW